ncbi:MAG: hypothetical protein QM784_00940 [Polyangiaceae bacterium]
MTRSASTSNLCCAELSRPSCALLRTQINQTRVLAKMSSSKTTSTTPEDCSMSWSGSRLLAAEWVFAGLRETATSAGFMGEGYTAKSWVWSGRER